MISGQPYDARCAELSALRHRAKQLCHRFNTLSPDAKAERKAILHKLFDARVSTHIEPHFYCDYGVRIQLGNGVFVNHNVTMLDGGGITIGDGTLIGPGVVLATTSHPKHDLTQSISQPIIIGARVLIGANATICPGVSIGDGAQIGAGAVIRQHVAAGATVV